MCKEIQDSVKIVTEVQNEQQRQIKKIINGAGVPKVKMCDHQKGDSVLVLEATMIGLNETLSQKITNAENKTVAAHDLMSQRIDTAISILSQKITASQNKLLWAALGATVSTISVLGGTIVACYRDD